jgi:NADP-dependent 3-hydroxy acid dehydrogenase YdfG
VGRQRLVGGTARDLQPDETKQGVEQFYAATAITADDIAEIIAFAVSRPRSVSLNEILVRPTARVG